jgi:hypothetical protein
MPKNITLERIISTIICHMIQNNIFADVSMQDIIDETNTSKDFLTRLIDENVFLRRDISNEAGVLSDKEVISFSFDEFRDFLIADYLYNISSQTNIDYTIKFISEEVMPQKILFEGVSKYLFFFSKKDKNNTLANVVKETSWYSEKYIPYIFQTDDDHLLSDDVAKVKEIFLGTEQKRIEILYVLINHRYDTSTCKQLNIALLYNILVELNEQDFDAMDCTPAVRQIGLEKLARVYGF